MTLLNTAKLEKMMLAKKIGRFLTADQSDAERKGVEDAARVLVDDVSTQVREVLAFELRKCTILSHDIAEKIAKDIEQVAAPFLSLTTVFSD